MRHVLNFTPSDDLRDQLRRSAVPLRRRRQGHAVNPLAHTDLRIQSLAYLGAPAAFGGNDGFDVYAFDNWQLLDEMVDWEGLVPNAEMTDAAHRNGVPMLGTVFLNWSTAQADRDRVDAILQEDSEDSGTYPAARKLAEMAEYYGFDGYFFNQETAMPADQGYGESWMSFLSYLKRYAEQQNYPLLIAWYDAMHNNGRRYHGDGVSEANNMYILPDADGLLPVDQFFMNFNWRTAQVDSTVQEMKKAGRSPYDAYAGLELQANGAYRMNVNREALIDPESRQGRLSLGLFVPDTIMGLAEDGEDLHRHEAIFWTGPGGDPATADDAGSWSGIARWAADKTAAVALPFNTFFNTGHGRRWFTDGLVSRDNSWNSRSVQDLMPTWRWRIRNNGGNGITARYDFDSAYNGGTSLRFEGELASGGTTEIMLYSTELALEAETVLKAAASLSPGAHVRIGLNTDPAYSDDAFTYYDLSAGDNWQITRHPLRPLSGQTVYAISVQIEAGESQNNWAMNLGGLAILNDEASPARPAKGGIAEVLLHNAMHAEAIVHVPAVENAEFYEVYQSGPDGFEIITASASPIIYLPQITRPEHASGTEQDLMVRVMGRNGIRSEGLTLPFDWGLETVDAPAAAPEPVNIMTEARVIEVNGEAYAADSGSTEGPRNLLSGTISNTADKWWHTGAPANVAVAFDEAKTVRRWVVEHAGAGGESANDGLMNTRDFDLEYKDETSGEWRLVHAVRNNIAHVTDIVLPEPVTAKEWNLKIITADNGSPWGGVRVYNWKMYEATVTETKNVPMSRIEVLSMGGSRYDLVFRDGVPGAELQIFPERDGSAAIADGTLDSEGHLLLPDTELPADRNMVYYRCLAEGMEPSVIAPIRYGLDDERPHEREVTLDLSEYQTTYLVGTQPDTETRIVNVSYLQDGDAVTAHSLALRDARIDVRGFNPDATGSQTAEIRFRDEAIGMIELELITAGDLADFPIEALSFGDKPRAVYMLGREFPRSDNGSIFVKYRGGLTTEPIPLDTRTEDGDYAVGISGYEPFKPGRQRLTFEYGGSTLAMGVTVEPANTEYLGQVIAPLEELTGGPGAEALPEALRRDAAEAIIRGRELHGDPLAVQQDVNAAASRIEALTAQIREYL